MSRYTLTGPDGAALAWGATLLEIITQAKALAVPKRRETSIRLTAAVLSGFRSVAYHGETLSGFLCSSALREIARRCAEWGDDPPTLIPGLAPLPPAPAPAPRPPRLSTSTATTSTLGRTSMRKTIAARTARAPKLALVPPPAPPPAATCYLGARALRIVQMALEEGKARGLFPASYTVQQLAEDAAVERATMVIAEALGLQTIDAPKLGARPHSGHLFLLE